MKFITNLLPRKVLSLFIAVTVLLVALLVALPSMAQKSEEPQASEETTIEAVNVKTPNETESMEKTESEPEEEFTEPEESEVEPEPEPVLISETVQAEEQETPDTKKVRHAGKALKVMDDFDYGIKCL